METYTGVVKHYYSRLGVAVLSLTADLKMNETVHIMGRTTDFYQRAWSMEINHHKVEMARPGEDVAVKVVDVVRKGDKIYLAPEAVPTEPGEIINQRIDEWERQ